MYKKKLTDTEMSSW